jgi:hypothetical protein
VYACDEAFADAEYDAYGNELHDDDGADDDQDDDGSGLEGGLGILLNHSSIVEPLASACLVF